MLEGYLFDKTAESRLWRRVVMQAIRDSAKGSASMKLGIKRWLDSRDFDTVCHYAAMDPDFIWNEIMEILSSPGVVGKMRAMALREAILLKDGDEDD